MNRTTPRVLVADDDLLWCSLLESTLEEAGLTAVTAGTGDEALAEAAAADPSVAVLDVKLPGRSGYEVCRELRRRFGPAIAIVLVTGERTEDFDRIAGMMLGADDFFSKPVDPADVLRCVQAHVERLTALGRARHLTPREREVLALLADGLAQPEIAARLSISPRTVGTHVDRILVKLNVHSRAQAVAAAYRDTSLA